MAKNSDKEYILRELSKDVNESVRKQVGFNFNTPIDVLKSLSQDKQGVDLAGLRDISKSFAASSALESLISCERVIGGRSFDQSSRVTEARANIHVFGIVEGENDLILMGMIKDITSKFTTENVASMLSVLQEANMKNGAPVEKEERILKIDLKTF